MENWTYSLTFPPVPLSVTNANVVQIRFDGLDTVAQVVLNGAQIGTAKNMFSNHIFDCKSQISSFAPNTLEVRFESPVTYAQNRYEEEIRDRHEVPPKCIVPEYRGECHANHIRKMQASFAWDWGPAFPSMGIYAPIHLESYDSMKRTMV